MKEKYLEDTKKSAVLFILAWILYAIVYMTKNCYSAAMAEIVAKGVLTKTQTGTITAAFYLTYAPFQILGGAAADKYSPGKLILIGTIGAAAANLTVFFTHSYTVMLTAWTLNGMIQFGIWPAIFKIVSTQLAPEHRSKGVFYITTAGVAGLISSYICAAVIKSWENNFLFSAISLLVISAVWLPAYKVIGKSMLSRGTASVSRRRTAAASGEGRLSLLLRSGLIFLLFASVIRAMLDLGIKSMIPVMLTESYASVSPTLASVLNIIIIIAGFFGLYAAAFIFPKKIHDEATSLTAFFIAAIPMVFVIMLLGKINVGLIIGALALFIMLMSGAGQFTTVYIAVRFNKMGRGAEFAGLFNCMASIGVVLSNYGFARLADDFGWSVTVKCWVVLSAVAAALACADIPLWKRFLRKQEKVAD